MLDLTTDLKFQWMLREEKVQHLALNQLSSVLISLKARIQVLLASYSQTYYKTCEEYVRLRTTIIKHL